MRLDRGTRAAALIVLAFSMLWLVAILLPEDRHSVRSLGLSGEMNGMVIHAEYPLIIKSTKQNIRTVSKGTQTPRQSRVLVETTQLSSRQSQPMTTESQPIYTQSDESQQPHHTRRLFPAYVWYLTALFLYKTRNFVKRRNQREFDYTDESFFRKSGLDSSLEYGYGLEYEDPDDFLSVTSNYGSTSRWTPDSLDKFDLELELTDSQI